ncbi:MAG: SPFH domain-containing protein [Bulleidia sp.]|nr:SPFH domain-containing protein [Bulleidia sp.]
MGLISTALLAANSTLRDSWKEYFYCEAIPADTFIVKGIKRKSGGLFGGNNGSDNIITDGSIIAVADGQAMIIVEQGQVVDICAEPGEFKYDSSTQPSVFTGSLGEGVKKMFEEFGRRFTFGGTPATDQRIYYINTKELLGVKYGTPAPVPFRVVDERAGIDIDISLKCFGEYSLHVSDPILFYTNVCANVSDSFKVSDIEDQLRSELLTALQPAFGKLSEQGVRYSQITTHTAELAEALNEELSSKWREKRGIEILSFGVSSIKADESDEEMIKQMQRNAAYTDANLAAATLVGAQAQAMQDAAKNSNGAAMGFVGMNAAQSAGGINANALYQAGQAQKENSANKWFCPECGHENHSNFCSNCGTKKPE